MLAVWMLLPSELGGHKLESKWIVIQGLLEQGGLPLLARQTLAVLSMWRRLLWPSDLSIAYDVPTDPSHMVVAACTLAHLLIIGGALAVHRRAPVITLAVLAAYISLIPTNTILSRPNPDPTRPPEIVSDRNFHFSLALAGIAAAWLLARLLRKVEGRRRHLVWAGAGLVLIILAGLSWRQMGTYRSPIALWQQAVAVSPHLYRPHVNLGTAYAHAGRHEEAETQFVQAAGILGSDHVLVLQKMAELRKLQASAASPDRAFAFWTEAERLYRKLLEVHPNDPHGLAGLGETIQALSRAADGEQERDLRAACHCYLTVLEVLRADPGRQARIIRAGAATNLAACLFDLAGPADRKDVSLLAAAGRYADLARSLGSNDARMSIVLQASRQVADHPEADAPLDGKPFAEAFEQRMQWKPWKALPASSSAGEKMPARSDRNRAPGTGWLAGDLQGTRIRNAAPSPPHLRGGG